VKPIILTVIANLALSAGCSKQEQPPAATQSAVATAREQPPAKPVPAPVPNEEPPAEVVERLIFEQYAEWEKMGGLPVTFTATGRAHTLHAKLYKARKESCTPSPQQPAGNYECSLTITLSLAADGKDPSLRTPSEQGARIGVKWDPSGKWVGE